MPADQTSRIPETVGYVAGHRQAVQTVDFALALPQRVDLRHLDAWLSQALGITPSSDPPRVFASAGFSPALAAVAWRVLRVAQELLSYARVPVFEPGTLLARGQADTDGRIPVRALVPALDYYPRQAHLTACAWAADTLRGMLSTPLSAEAIARVQTLATEQLLDPVRARVPAGDSIIPILSAAFKRDIPFRHLGGGVFQLGQGSRARRVSRGAVDDDQALAMRIAGNKVLTVNLLGAAGFPVPEQRVSPTEDAAVANAQALGFPAVIKPADRERGEGVSVDIRTPEQAREGWQAAAALSQLILVEQQIPGTCHRLSVIRGKVIHVTRRLPKSVRGDGRHSVAELIALANREEAAKPPWQRLKPFPDDALALATMQAAGFERGQVPAAGVWVPLRPKQTSDWGGVVEHLTAETHPDNLELAERATASLGLANAGVDLISVDIRRPWHENGAAINEINYSPQLSPSADNLSLTERILDRYFDGDGRIPVEVVYGGEPSAAQAALRRQQALCETGLSCFLVTGEGSFAPDGKPVQTTAGSRLAMASALLLRPEVGALVVALDASDLQPTLPFDRITVLHSATPGPAPSALESLAQAIAPTAAM
ncbi:MAG: hypothetical protein WCY32_08925 [Burkholderiaceae bacterium]